MKLSKALKLKNKKINEYNKTVDRMLTCNSYDVDSKKLYNAHDLYRTAVTLRNDLAKFKTAIHQSTAPIRHLIFELSELKSFLSRLNHLDTTEGIVKSRGYGSVESSKYDCDIKEETKEELINNLQEQIEIIQEEIDSFNATTDLTGY